MGGEDTDWDPATGLGGPWGHRLLGWQPTGSCWEGDVDHPGPERLLDAVTCRENFTGKWAGSTVGRPGPVSSNLVI